MTRYQLRDINPVVLRQWMGNRLEAGLSPKYVQNMRAVLHAAFEQAVRDGLLERNPVDAVRRPRAPRREMHFLTPEQARCLLQAARGDRLYALYALALSTGMRLGELLGLSWGRVDLEAGTVHVHRQLQRLKGMGLVLTELKSAYSQRSIQLPREVVRALREHRALQERERLEAGQAWANKWDLVFTTKLGTPIDPQNLTHRSFKRLLKEAGLPDIRFHDLRHTAAALMLRQIPVHAVREILGHSSIKVTVDIYAHVIPQTAQEAAAVMNHMLFAEAR